MDLINEDGLTAEELEDELYDLEQEKALINRELEMLKKRKAWIARMQTLVKRDIKALTR